MTVSVVLSKYIVLQDLVQGFIDVKLSEPIDGFLGSSHHNVVAPAYRVGTKIRYYSPTLKGYGAMAYLQAGTAPGVAIAKGQTMVPAGATQNSTLLPYKYTNDPDDGVLGGPCVFAISAMTNDYYGWFWCEGVAPIGIDNAGILTDTAVATANTLAIGAITTVDLTDVDNVGVDLAVTLKNDCGFSMKAND